MDGVTSSNLVVGSSSTARDGRGGVMPKEYVDNPFRVMYDDRGGEVEVGSNVVTKVTWNRDAGYVQIATIIDDRRDDSSNSVGPDPHSLDSGLYSDLDRDGINRLIRILRRARDQAYGRDE